MADRQVVAYHQGMVTGKYLHWEALWNRQGNGLMQQLQPLEAELYRLSETTLTRWRQSGKPDQKEMKQLYEAIEAKIQESLLRW